MRTLYRAGLVHTLSHPATGEWVLVDDRHVERVGVGEPPEADRVVDLPGTNGVPTGALRREANWALQRWYHEQLGDHEVRELQLQSASLAASRGVTSVHEMAIPESRGLRDF